MALHCKFVYESEAPHGSNTTSERLDKLSSLYLFVGVIDNGQFTPVLAVMTFVFRTEDGGSTAGLDDVAFNFETGTQQNFSMLSFSFGIL